MLGGMSSLLNLKLLREFSFFLNPFHSSYPCTYIYLVYLLIYALYHFLVPQLPLAYLLLVHPALPPIVVLMIDPLLRTLLELLPGEERMRSNGKNFFSVSLFLLR
jgi:hypothetical protein